MRKFIDIKSHSLFKPDYIQLQSVMSSITVPAVPSKKKTKGKRERENEKKEKEKREVEKRRRRKRDGKSLYGRKGKGGE